jgi:hypothetical protein
MRRQIWIVLTIVFLIIAVGLTTYFLKYHGPESDKSEDWSHFGHYIEVYVSLASLVLIGFVSIITHEINERSTNIANRNLESAEKFQKYQMTPVLDLAVERSHQDYYPTYKDSWFIINCSIAAARNISLKFWLDETESFYITLYSMGEKSKLELPWLRYARKIQIVYSDATAKTFYEFEMVDLRGNFKEIASEDYVNKRSEKCVNGANVLLDFNDRFLKVKGRPLTNTEYADFFETFKKI